MSEFPPCRRDYGRAKRKPYAFRFPEALVKAIDNQAKKNGVSRAWMLETLLKRALGQEVEDELMRADAAKQDDLFA